jgi:hypothetical protein
MAVGNIHLSQSSYSHLGGLEKKMPRASFSDDGGKTWEVNFITDQTWVKDEPDKAH